MRSRVVKASAWPRSGGASLVNARLRKRYLRGGFRVAAIGPALDLTFPVEMLGEGGEALNALARGEGRWSEVLRAAKAPMIVLGQGALARPDGARVLGTALAIAENFGMVRPEWNGFNVLHRAAARVGGLDPGGVLRLQRRRHQYVNPVRRHPSSFAELSGLKRTDCRQSTIVLESTRLVKAPAGAEQAGRLGAPTCLPVKIM